MSVSRILWTRQVIVSVFILAFALAACGDSSDSESNSVVAPSATIADDTVTATQVSTATAAASNTPFVPPTSTVEPAASATATSTPTTEPTADSTMAVAATEVTSDRVEVIIDQFAFAPAMLEITAGTTVVFTSREPFEHTATESEYPYLFDSGNLDTGDSFEFTFDTPGTYEYFCRLHPTMLGTIVVS